MLEVLTTVIIYLNKYIIAIFLGFERRLFFSPWSASKNVLSTFVQRLVFKFSFTPLHLSWPGGGRGGGRQDEFTSTVGGTAATLANTCICQNYINWLGHQSQNCRDLLVYQVICLMDKMNVSFNVLVHCLHWNWTIIINEL